MRDKLLRGSGLAQEHTHFGDDPKIELTFRHALRVVGSYAYHFWMQGMTPLRRVSGNQYMHRKSDRYRQQVRRKTQGFLSSLPACH